MYDRHRWINGNVDSDPMLEIHLNVSEQVPRHFRNRKVGSWEEDSARYSRMCEMGLRDFKRPDLAGRWDLIISNPAQ
jgi:hypothetical protein